MPTMTTASLAKKLTRLEAMARTRMTRSDVMIDVLRREPGKVMTAAGMTPDTWQEGLLHSPAARMLMLASRQSGKSSVAAALALRTVLLRPRSPVLLLSPTLRQSGEIFRKILDLFNALGRPIGVTSESALRLELANGSRILSLPGTEGTVRGFSGVAMLIIDEAARVADALYCAVRPMLAVSQGRLVALSTPFGKRGWFHDEWHGTGDWERVRITAAQCPRIPPAFLAEERKSLGERWYRQEYETSFEDTIDAVFAYEDIQAALRNDIKPLFGE
jgi:hypothetical protein